MRQKKIPNSRIKAAVFSAALLTGCASPHVPCKTQPIPHQQVQTKQKQSEKKSVEDQKVKGITLKSTEDLIGHEVGYLLIGRDGRWMNTYSYKITDIGDKTVTMDIKLWTTLHDDSWQKIFLNFKGVEIPREEIEYQVKRTKKEFEELKERENNPILLPVLFNEQAPNIPTAGFHFDNFELVNDSLSQSGLVILLARLLDTQYGKTTQDGKPRMGVYEGLKYGSERLRFSVESANETEFILRINGGKCDGRTFRLGREVNVEIDSLNKEQGFIASTYRIDSISTGKNVEVKVSHSPSGNRLFRWE